MAESYSVDAKKLLDEIRADPKLNELLQRSISGAKEEADRRSIDPMQFEAPVVTPKGSDCSGCISCLACGVTPGIPDIEVGVLFAGFHVND